ncbi:HesB/IscA family protein [Kaarinaea lacus]
MPVTLTESAAKHVQNMLDNRGHGMGLRLGTKASGCSGFSYVVDYADEINETEDLVFECHGVTVVVDKQSLTNLDGMTVDYVKNNILNEGFEFINPNVADMCGCGESFSVK